MKKIIIGQKEKTNMLLRLTNLQMRRSVFLIFIPLLLFFKTGDWLPSISDYYYSSARDEFVVFLTIASILYLNDGFLKNKWWNISIGISLIGIAYFPHIEFPIIHYTLACCFFLGTSISMVLFSSKKQRKYKILVTIFILIFMCMHFFFNVFSLLVAEWLCMVPMSIHFIGEVNGKID